MENKNIVWHNTTVKREDREKLLHQKGKVLWFTGLSGSGKSTVANLVEKKLHEKGRLTYMLDGDNIRHGLNVDLGFTLEDRKENLRRIGEVSKLFLDAGVVTLATFISPLIEDRLLVRNIVGEDFIEIYIDCPLEVCEERDPKGLYGKARLGEIKNFTGITSPYEAPDNPELVLKTHIDSLEQCADKVISYLENL